MQFVLYDKNTVATRHRIRTNGGFSCIVRNCRNRTTEKQYKFFRLPAKDRNRLEQWLEVCQRDDLKGKSEKSLSQNYKICSYHFEQKMYANPEDLMNRLLPTAIPTLFLPKENMEIDQDRSLSSRGDQKVVKTRKKGSSVQTRGSYKQNKLLGHEENNRLSDKVEEAFLQNQNNLDEDKIEEQPDPISVNPLGDDLLRVCRTCFRIMKIEEAVPLYSSITGYFEETKLCVRLKRLLQVNLFDVENPCLCKKCETFINAVDSFRSTCLANDEVLKDFDWDMKTRNLLFVVDQDELKSAYDQAKSEETEESVATSLTEDHDFAEKWLQQDKRGNGLSDMEDHWYNTNTVVKLEDHDYTSRSPGPCSSTSLLPKDEDLFSPNFDKYFERVQNRVSQRLRIRCRRYHNKNEGNGPFLCELCGKVKVSRPAFYRHMRFHKSSNCFRCIKCNKMLYERSCYLKHCKTVHGTFPRTLKCPRCPKMYLYKKHFDTHLRIHESDDSKQVCPICRDVFNDKSLFDKHKLMHKPNKIEYEVCGGSIDRGSLKRPIKTKQSKRNILRSGKARVTFQCSLCKRSYSRIGCFELHQKYCNGEMCFKVLR